ncbi:MAG: hypothetical protein ACQXXD_01240 [Thermoplasmatota archaeon]|jgi:hypothetical protein
MPASGLFITLYDEDTLRLYLDKGIYGFHQNPCKEKMDPRDRHYNALADYACAREGTHVFFFLKRMIIYGGQIIGSKKYGSYYLNGPYSAMGKRANAPVVWDESKRSIYQSTGKPGIFIVPKVDKKKEKCQPYLLRFKDRLNLKGNWITSDDLYFALGSYPYPLPTNSIQNMSFCTMTPGETEIALSLLRESEKRYTEKGHDEISLTGEPILFDPKFGTQNLIEALKQSWFINEAQLEASIISNPYLLPKKVRPNENDTICRQIPISPFKPNQMDRADICYYSEKSIREGTIPNTIIELKLNRTGKGAIEQVERYMKWLHKCLGEQTASLIKVYVCAPSFTSIAFKSIPREYAHQIELISFEDTDLLSY